MLKTDYKQTELGLIPSDWEVKSFKDICWVNQGLQIAIENRLKYPNENSKQYITIQSLNNPKDLEYINSYSTSVCCNSSDILMTRTGNTGIVISGVEGVFHNNFFKINYNKNLLDKDYLLYYLKDPRTKKIILEKAGTSTIPDLNHNDFYSIPIPLPPTKDEQSAIAKVLSNTDDLISSLENLIAKKKAIKQGTMQRLLTPKDGWEVKKLGEVGKCYRGVSYNPEIDLYEYDNKNTIRLFRSNNIFDSTLNTRNIQFVNQSRVKNNQIVLENDIIICMANGSKQLVGKSAVFSVKDNLKYTFGAFMGCFRINKSIANPEFIAISFQSNQYRNYIDVLLSGSSINNLNPQNIESISIPFPSIPEQTAIATTLSDMDEEIQALQLKCNKYKQLKAGLMQQLLTGKIRLSF